MAGGPWCFLDEGVNLQPRLEATRREAEESARSVAGHTTRRQTEPWCGWVESKAWVETSVA